MYHTLKLVVNNNSQNSTEVFLDEKLFGTIQEHFVSRLKGGVFVLNKFEGVALFKKFKLNSIDKGMYYEKIWQ